MKKYSIEEIETSNEFKDIEDKDTSKKKKTPVSFTSKKQQKRKKIKRIVISSIVIIILGLIGWFGWISYNAMTKIFNGQAPSLLSLFNPTQLKGESSGRVNVLLLGIGGAGHDGGNLTDTIMIASYDVKSKNVAMISVPRDLYVKVGNYGYSKINAANSYGTTSNYPGGGAKLTEETVSKVTGLPIHYYALVDFSGFKNIIDTVGGVDINVEKDLYDPLYPHDDGLKGPLYIKKGMQHMNGAQALRYARSRETTSDFDRAKRQQQVIVAIRSKVLSTQTLLNPAKIASIIQVLGDHIKTDFQLNEAQRIIELAKGIDTSKIINKVIDNGANGLLVNDSSPNAGYILIPRIGIGNYKEIQALAANIFVDSKLQTEAAKISVMNGTTRSGLASRFSEKLKNLNFNVIYTGSADTADYSNSVIYDFSNGQKSATITYLENLLGVKSQKKTQSDGTGAEIEVILGKNYSE